MRRSFVVVGPRLVGAQRERPARHEDVAVRVDLGKPIRAGQAGERERLRHRLDVLELVLRDHADDEVVPRQLGEPVDYLLAHLRDVGTRVLRGEDGQRPPLGSPVCERVVQIVELAAVRVATSEQPELLEVPDVSEIPDERRLKRRDLPRQLLVRERLQQGFGSPARVLEDRGELSR